MILLTIAAMEDDDDKAFMLNLYKNYYGIVRKTVYDVTNDTKDIEDLINDTFLNLIKKISLIRTLNCCKTAAYVVYTARNVAINFIKHRDVQKKRTYYGGDKDFAEELPAHENIPEDRLVYKQEIESLSNAILSLPERQKDLLYFKYILEMKDEEIAKSIGIAPDSVRQYLTRARRNAKKLMGKE